MAGWFDPAGIHTGLDFYRQIVESTHDCVKIGTGAVPPRLRVSSRLKRSEPRA